MTDNDASKFGDVGLAPDKDVSSPRDGHPRRRSPRDASLGAADELELPGSPNFNDEIDASTFLLDIKAAGAR